MKLRCLVAFVWSVLVAPFALSQNTPRKPVVYLIGDSTVNTPTRGQLGWGAALPEFFDLTKVSIENKARGGRSSRTYFSEGLWQEVFDQLQPGDFVLMQFGHNDGGAINDNFRARASIKGIGEESQEIDNILTKKHETVYSFGWYLRRYINDAKTKGATPIVLSPVPRNNWKNGKVERAYYDYGSWSREVAQQTNVTFIDLNDITARHYETLTPEQVKADYFTEADNTHTSPAGAARNAASVALGIQALPDSRVGSWLKKYLKPFDRFTFSFNNADILKANVAMQRIVASLHNSLSAIQKGFENPPDDAKIMMRWWWFGPAVTKAGIERELRTMKEAGIGGIEIQPVYPLALDDESVGRKNLRFLSPEFLDCLKFANDKARELGMRVDLTLGSGWPFGGPQVPITQAASKLRVARVAVTQATTPAPTLAEGESFVAAFAGNTLLTAQADGAFAAPAGTREITFFIASRTRMQVKRAAFGGEGYVLDHYDRAALDNYLRQVGEPLLQAFGANPPHAIFCDSLEVFSSDWSNDFLAEFHKRRGYDLKPLLPALVENDFPNAGAIRQDWGQTLTELLNERFMAPMQAWAKRHNTRFRIQGYGIPPATISSNQFADLTEGEGWQWKTLRAARWASSANHLFGRNITSSETWTWLHSPSFRATPLDMKAEADLHFLQGINQIIGHGWPYTGEGIEYPGWRLYAAANFNDKNPWFIAMPEISKYLQRLSYLMRQGQPANDVAFYLPNSDAWASFVSPKVHYMIDALKERIGDTAVAQVLEAGFNLDFFDDEVLQRLGRVEDKVFQHPYRSNPTALALGPNQYSAVVLPNVERLPLATLQKLVSFARQGGVVIATRRLPALLASYQSTEAERKQFKAWQEALFTGAKPLAHFVANDEQLGAKLSERLLPEVQLFHAAERLKPDVRLSSAAQDIGLVHRRTTDADIYFLVNSSNKTQDIEAFFWTRAMHVERWNPHTGEIASWPGFPDARGGIHVPLTFAPYESIALVISEREVHDASQSEAFQQSLDLSKDWRVSIKQTRQTLEQLRSWTDDATTRFYSGTATYEKEINLSSDFVKAARTIRLAFEGGQAVPITPRKNGMRAWYDAPVRDAAVVYVNDQRAGSVWCPPFTLDISKFLKPGVNRFRIVVGNTAINHLAGTKLPDYKEVHQRYGERFQPQDMENLQPLPSGLLGTIRLVAQ